MKSPNSPINVTYWSRLFFLLFLLLAVNSVATGQDAANYVKIDSVAVGDTFNYSIVLHTSRRSDEIIFPDSAAFGGSISIVDRKRFRLNKQTDSLSYTLQFFGTQEYTIPKLPIYLIRGNDTTSVYVPPVPLDFKSTLSKNSSLKPLKPIFNFAVNWWPYIGGLLAIALIGYLWYRWYKKRKHQEAEKERKKPFKPEPFIDPLEELRQNLEQVKTWPSPDNQEEIKEFYSEVGDIIRWYLERVYRVPALESTSRELIRDLHHENVPRAIIQSTEEVLTEADRVKFARYNPGSNRLPQIMEEAESFLKTARVHDKRRIEKMREEHEQEQLRLKKQHETSDESDEFYD